MNCPLLPDKLTIAPLVTWSTFKAKDQQALRNQVHKPRSDDDWDLLATLWPGLHIAHRAKIFDALNDFTKRLVLDQHGQFEEIEDADEFDPFLGINPYESFGELSQLIPFTIPLQPSPFTFDLQNVAGQSTMGRLKKTTEDKERDSKRLMHLNTVGRPTWAAKHGEGKDDDYANWRMFEPSSDQARRINSLIAEGKFNTNALSDNALGEFFPKNVKLSDSALGMVYRAGIASKQCARWWALDFNSSGAPLCNPMRLQIGQPSLSATGKVYQIWYGDKYKKTAYVLHGGAPATPKMLPPIELIRPGLKSVQSSDPNDDTVSQMSHGQSSPQLPPNARSTPTGFTLTSMQTVPPATTFNTYQAVVPDNQPPTTKLPPAMVSSMPDIAGNIDRMIDVDESEEETSTNQGWEGRLASLEMLLEQTQNRLQAMEERNEMNLDLTRAKLQATVRVARGLDQNQLELAKTLVKFYNVVRTATSARPASMQEYHKVWDVLRLAKDDVKPAVHAVNTQRSEVADALNDFPATKTRVFTHGNELEVATWLDQTEGWVLHDQGDQASRKRPFDSIE